MRTAHDLTVLKRFPLLKARLMSQAAAGFGSTSWASSFAPKGYAAHLADVLLMIRLQVLADPPSSVPCWCGEKDSSNGLFLEHVLTCGRVRGANRTFRHNNVLAALHHSVERFGLLTSVEPRFYEYADGHKKRPDLTCFVGGGAVVTDLVISEDPDSALKDKLAKHDAAALALGHKFIPIAMSIFGEFHPSVDDFLRKVFVDLPYKTRRLAILQTKRVMSEAWLTGTAAMVRGVLLRAEFDSTRDFCSGFSGAS